MAQNRTFELQLRLLLAQVRYLISERPLLYISVMQRTQKTSPKGISLFQFPEIKALGEEGFSYVFEGSELLAKATEGLDPKTCKYTTAILFDHNYFL